MSERIAKARLAAERAIAKLASAATKEATKGEVRLSKCQHCGTPLYGRVAKGRPRTVCADCLTAAKRDYQRGYKRKVRAAEKSLREEGVA